MTMPREGCAQRGVPGDGVREGPDASVARSRDELPPEPARWSESIRVRKLLDSKQMRTEVPFGSGFVSNPFLVLANKTETKNHPETKPDPFFREVIVQVFYAIGANHPLA